jgi:hypothetical protein
VSQTTLQNHPTIQIPVTSGVSYELEIFVEGTFGAGGNKTQITGPTTSRLVGQVRSLTNNTGQFGAALTSFPMQIEGGNSTNTYEHSFIFSSFTASANGTIILQFAQNASNAAASTLHKACRARICIV